jgi:hypothetical protein
MLIINKLNNTSFIDSNSNHPHVLSKQQQEPILIPKISKLPKHNYSFEEWYDIYKDQVDDIVNEYLNLINNFSSSSSDNKYHSINYYAFTNKLIKLIYDKSYNKQKNKTMYLPGP